MGFFAILDQLYSGTLPDGTIWLSGFSPYFFQHNSLCMGSTSKRVGLQDCAHMGFLVLFIMISSMGMEFPGSAKTVTFAHPTCTMGLSKREDLFLFRLLKTLGFSFKLKTYNFLPFWKIACHYTFITSFSSFCPLVFTKFKLALFIPFSPALNFFLIYSFYFSL